MENEYPEPYHSKQQLSSACSEIIEDLLRKTYEEENPFERFSEPPVQKADSSTTQNHGLGNHSPAHSEANSDYSDLLDVQSKEHLISPRQYSSSLTNNMVTSNTSCKASCGDSYERKKYVKDYFANMINNGVREERDVEAPHSRSSGEEAELQLHDYPQFQQLEAYFINSSCRSRSNRRPGKRSSEILGGSSNSNSLDEERSSVCLPPLDDDLPRLLQEQGYLESSALGQGDNWTMSAVGQDYEYFDNELTQPDLTNVQVTVSFSICAKIVAFAVTINMLLVLKYLFFEVLLPLL